MSIRCLALLVGGSLLGCDEAPPPTPPVASADLRKELAELERSQAPLVAPSGIDPASVPPQTLVGADGGVVACPAGACRREGRCARVGQRCQPSSDKDCVASERCGSDGYCQARHGRCVAGKAADCETAAVCRERGLCGVKHGVCVAKTSAHCLDSAECRKLGQCGLSGEECAATEARHCTLSAACTRHERCRVEAGRCVE